MRAIEINPSNMRLDLDTVYKTVDKVLDIDDINHENDYGLKDVVTLFIQAYPKVTFSIMAGNSEKSCVLYNRDLWIEYTVPADSNTLYMDLAYVCMYRCIQEFRRA